jgi:hypothetical protein
VTGPTFAAFRDVLLRLGFGDRSVPGKYHRFEHSMPNTWILLPAYKDNDVVPPYHVDGARDLLDYRGIAAPKDFEEALRQRSLAG